jgi:hypothetical protein
MRATLYRDARRKGCCAARHVELTACLNWQDQRSRTTFQYSAESRFRRIGAALAGLIDHGTA